MPARGDVERRLVEDGGRNAATVRCRSRYSSMSRLTNTGGSPPSRRGRRGAGGRRCGRPRARTRARRGWRRAPRSSPRRSRRRAAHARRARRRAPRASSSPRIASPSRLTLSAHPAGAPREVAAERRIVGRDDHAAGLGADPPAHERHHGAGATAIRPPPGASARSSGPAARDAGLADQLARTGRPAAAVECAAPRR